MTHEDDASNHEWVGRTSPESNPAGDVEEQVLAAMMEVAEGAKRDLQAILAEMAAITAEKRLLRDRVGRVRRARHDPSLADDVRTAENALTCMLDALSEMCEMDGLRLQKAMDRRAKSIGTLSNILTKIGKTEDGIIKNLK